VTNDAEADAAAAAAAAAAVTNAAVGRFVAVSECRTS